MKQQYGSLSGSALELVAARFRALGEPMRLRILQELQQGERNVTELVEALGATQANVSKHLSLLVQAGIVYKRRIGVNVSCGISDPSVFRLCDIVCGGIQKDLSSRSRLMES